MAVIHNACFSKILILTAALMALGITVAEGVAEPAPAALPDFGDYQAKGFLSDYSKLKPEGATATPIGMWTVPRISAATTSC